MENGYLTDQTWRRMQKYLPQKNQLRDGNLPKEYDLDLGDIQVHIDHYIRESPKGRVIMLHGVGGNGRLLSFLALPLQKSGFEVVCPDLPLYGYTKYAGTVTYDTWVSTGIKIVEHYQALDKAPTFLFGLSAGGMLAYQVACGCGQLAGLMASCILDQRNMEITKRTARHPLYAILGKPMMRAAHRAVGSLKIPLKMAVNMKAIANHKQVASLLLRDRKSSGVRVPISFIHTMLSPEISVEPEGFDRCPFLLVHPGDDRWTDLELSMLFYDRMACSKEFRVLEGAGHFPIEEKGLAQMEAYCLEFLTAHSGADCS